MSNHPDNMNWQNYDRTIGSILSAAETVWEAHASKLNETVALAYQKFPLNSTERREMLGAALQRTQNALTDFVLLSLKEKGALMMEYCGLMAGDAEGNREAVSQCVASYMHIYSNAIERMEKAA